MTGYTDKHEYTNKNGVTSVVYLMDCMKAMEQMGDKEFGLACVDPPYGGNDAIGLKDNSGLKRQSAKRSAYKGFSNVQPKPKYFSELKRVSIHQIIWGVNFYKGIDLSGGRICWDKKGTAFGRAELAYYSGSKSVNVVELVWNGMLQHDMKDKEDRIHPTQKPIALYDWIFKNYAKPNDTIFDSHCGSGSSRIAADRANLPYVATELDPDYFRDHCKRFDRYTSQLTIF